MWDDETPQDKNLGLSRPCSCARWKEVHADFGISLSKFYHYRNFYHIHTDFGISLCSMFKLGDPKRKPTRGYANILGRLVRKHFPGIVQLPSGGRDVAWTWKHYSYAEDPSGKYQNMQEQVVHHFWVRDFWLLSIQTLLG